VDEIVDATPDNRMVGYPYTKYMISIMDVDMAAAVLLCSHETADRLHVPSDRRVYPRGWCYATDATYVAEHDELHRSPAMAAAADEAMARSGIGVDDVAHIDVYSCFGSSVHFAQDALGLAEDDARGVTVTGGLPYHGGAGSNYMTHSIATMVDVLRRDPGAYGLVSGVGMHMTKHVYGIYCTEPGDLTLPDQAAVQRRVDGAHPPCRIVDSHDGDATVAAYSVIHGRDGSPETGVLVCDVPAGRVYATLGDADALRGAEEVELVGRTVRLSPQPTTLPTGEEGTVNRAVLA
jgi:acetyl-CoA C-acetyltransferase